VVSPSSKEVKITSVDIDESTGDVYFAGAYTGQPTFYDVDPTTKRRGAAASAGTLSSGQPTACSAGKCGFVARYNADGILKMWQSLVPNSANQHVGTDGDVYVSVYRPSHSQSMTGASADENGGVYVASTFTNKNGETNEIALGSRPASVQVPRQRVGPPLHCPLLLVAARRNLDLWLSTTTREGFCGPQHKL